MGIFKKSQRDVPLHKDAIQRCPALIVLKEDNNNNSAAVGLINAACDIKLCR